MPPNAVKITHRIPPLIIAAVVFIFCGVPATPTPAEESAPLSLEARVLTMYRGYKARQFPQTPDVTVADILSWQPADELILVDVRSGKEQAVSRIPGALTQKEFEARRSRLVQETVVTYCTIGSRSGIYARKLRGQGIRAYNLIGGVLSWALAGQTFTGPDGEETRRVHVYAKTWNLLPDGYEAVY